MEKGILIGGEIPVLCESSNDGEFWGISLAIRTIIASLKCRSPISIVLQCDNLCALAWMERFHPNARPVSARHNTHAIPEGAGKIPAGMWTAVEVVRKMDPSITVWLKHVKGHDKNKTARSWANKQCDAQARVHMAEKRTRIRNRSTRA